MKPNVRASFTIFAVVSEFSVAHNGALARVYAVNIGCLFEAFVAGNVLPERREGGLPGYVIWMLLGAVGLFLWDILSALVVVKAEVFMGWYVLYPMGLVGLVVLSAIGWCNLQAPVF